MITDPRRLDPARSAPLLGAVVESAPTAIVMVDADGRIVLVNAETEKLFGYPREGLIGRSVEMLLPSRFRDEHAVVRRAYFDRPQARRMGVGRSLHGLRRDGSEFPVEIGLSPVETGKGVFVLSAVVDIGERLRMEQEQRLLSSLVETVEDYAILLLDPEGRVTTWNAGAERIKGYRADEIIGRHFSCFYVPEDLAAGRPEAELATAAAAGRHAEEGWRVRADGSRFWALSTVTALRDTLGTLVGYSKITRDLTEQRRAEQRFRATIESAPTAMVMIDARGAIVLLNSETEKLFGYERNELLAQPVEVLLPGRFRDGHPRLREDFFARPEARPMGAGRDLFGRRRDGSEFPVEIGLNPVQTDQGIFVLSAIVDITERKRLEEAQRRLNQELEQRVEERTAELEVARDAAQAASRAKSEFLANMSHEIRTPLNAVIGLTEAVLRTPLSEAQRDHLRTVMDSGEALLNVINDILDFSKIEVGKLELERAPFDLHEVLSGTLRSQAMRAQLKGVELACFVDPRLPAQRLGDPGRIRQVLTNLVSNAIKFTEGGEVVVRVEGGPGDDRLRFSVRDTGIGIEPDQLGRLFEPFEQADSSTTRRHGGTGLGLSISRQLVELMDGRIGARSALGAGSTFFFEVDVPPLGGADRRDRMLEGRSALLVDPHPTTRGLLAETLRGHGMRPLPAATGEEAIAHLERGAVKGEPIELLLIDRALPYPGWEGLVDRIREDARFDAAKILLLASVQADVDVRSDAARCVVARLLKPVDQSELIAAMSAALVGAPRPGAPAAADAQRSPASESEAERAAAPRRILVVEDSVANQKVVRAILAGQGHVLVFAANGHQALERLAEAEFDGVLMDVQMPEMDGLEATAAIRAAESGSDRHIQIVAMTAHAMEGDREKCLAAGMDDYVSKPIRRAELLGVLEGAGDPGSSSG